LYSLVLRSPPSTLFPYTTLFRSPRIVALVEDQPRQVIEDARLPARVAQRPACDECLLEEGARRRVVTAAPQHQTQVAQRLDDTVDRKSTRLNSSHRTISYAVFCL